MFLVVDQSELIKMPLLRRTMFVDRAQQFVERHRWPLQVDDFGLETDEFDDPLTSYCIVEEERRHLASVRLRPAASSSMVERYFPGLWENELRSELEITRFCASTALTPDDRLSAVSDLLLGLCRHCQRSGIGRIFGVVFPSVARVIKQAGWPGAIRKEMRNAGGTLLLAQWTPSDLAAWSIQERREMREELWNRRRELTAEPERRVA